MIWLPSRERADRVQLLEGGRSSIGAPVATYAGGQPFGLGPMRVVHAARRKDVQPLQLAPAVADVAAGPR